MVPALQLKEQLEMIHKKGMRKNPDLVVTDVDGGQKGKLKAVLAMH